MVDGPLVMYITTIINYQLKHDGMQLWHQCMSHHVAFGVIFMLLMPANKSLGLPSG
jgi:hypothetical protein